MARIKRWTQELLASIDGMIVQVENHEALATSTLRELERGVARSKVQLMRVERDGQVLRQALAEEREAATRWRERAKREEPQTRALECLRRCKRSEARVSQLLHDQAEHAIIEQQLERDIRTLERRVIELRQQRNTLRTRQSRAEAFTIAQGASDAENAEIFAIFERWDMRVTETEVSSGCLVVTSDSFDEELLDAERTAALELELREIKEERS